MDWVGGGLLMLALGRGRRRGSGKRRLSMTSVSRVFVLENLTPATNFYRLKDSECSLMLSLIVFLRNWFIASLKVLNYNLEHHLTKVYDCVHFIQGRKKTFLLCFFSHSSTFFAFTVAKREENCTCSSRQFSALLVYFPRRHTVHNENTDWSHG